MAIYSEEGVGTTVKIYLPLVSVDGAAPAAVGTRAPHGSETLLLVDDDSAVRELSSRVLRAHGYRVLEASDAEAALEIVAGEEVRLLITDVVLRGTGGRELAELVVRKRPSVRVLFISGYTEDLIFQRRLLEGDVELLQKPFTAEALVRGVRGALDGRAYSSGARAG
jgi:two-component system, cell cycle sensor histidine kinase and response regulator CckA